MANNLYIWKQRREATTGSNARKLSEAMGRNAGKQCREAMGGNGKGSNAGKQRREAIGDNGKEVERREATTGSNGRQRRLAELPLHSSQVFRVEGLEP